MSADPSPAETRHLFAVGAADAGAVLVACQADPPDGTVIEGLSRPRLEMALLTLALLVVDNPAALQGYHRPRPPAGVPDQPHVGGGA